MPAEPVLETDDRPELGQQRQRVRQEVGDRRHRLMLGLARQTRVHLGQLAQIAVGRLHRLEVAVAARAAKKQLS